MLVLTDMNVIDNVTAFVITEDLSQDKKSLIYNVVAISNMKIAIASFSDKVKAIALLHSIGDEYAKGTSILDLRLYGQAKKESEASDNAEKEKE